MKNIKQSFKIIFLGLLLSGGLALAFTAPATSFPNGNTDEPINVGSSNQYKSGGLATGALSVFSGPANFFGGVKILGTGASQPTSNLYIAGKAGVSTTGATPPSAGLEVLGNVKASSLAHASGVVKICANSTGLIVLCPTGSITFTPATCPYPSGCNWTVPDGVFRINVKVYGAGGGGGVGGGGYALGAGGGGGGYKEANHDVQPGQPFSLAAGAKGSTAPNVNSSATAGQPSYFSFFYMATGGGGGGNQSGPGGPGGSGYWGTANDGATGGTGVTGTTSTAGAGGIGAGPAPTSDGGKAGGYPTAQDGKVIISW